MALQAAGPSRGPIQRDMGYQGQVRGGGGCAMDGCFHGYFLDGLHVFYGCFICLSCSVDACLFFTLYVLPEILSLLCVDAANVVCDRVAFAVSPIN